MTRSLAIAGAAVAACAAFGTPLLAQGNSVDQQSACMAGRVGAGVASPCDDGSAIYFSPAGLAMNGSAISAGVQFVHAGNTFRYDPNLKPDNQPASIKRDAETVPVPQVFASFRANDRLAAGIGAFAPYGLKLEWDVCPTATPNCAGTNFEGRYTGYKNSLRGIYIQPTVAYQLIPGALALGVGVDFVHMTIDVNQRAEGSSLGLNGRDIADVRLKGDGNAVTANASAILKLSNRTMLGVRYLHSAKVDLNGDATFVQIPTGTVFDPLIALQTQPGGNLSNQGISTTVELPAQIVAGISFRPIDPLNLLFDYQRTKWSSFDAFDIAFENKSSKVLNLNYKDTNTFRFAAEYGWSESLALRAGFRYNTAASPRATPFLPENERNYYTAGIGYRVTRGLSADLSYQYIHQPERFGAVRPDGPIVGTYDASGQVFGFTLAYHFGGGAAGQQ